MKEFRNNGDAAIERHLREALQARLAPEPSGTRDNACLDPETLAAWADNELGARERAAAEAHAADCSRCQALLAAMIRTTEPSAEAKSWWRMPAIKWLTPLAAVATALVMWAIVPSRPGVQPVDHLVPEVNEKETSRAPASSVNPFSESRSVARSPGDHATQPEPSDKNEIPSTAAKALSPAPTDAATALSAASPSVPVAAPPQGSIETPQPAMPPTAAQESFARALRQEGNMAEIISTNPGSRWRILPGGAVERSIDNGSTWETQQTGVSVTLVAGASPSPAICWLVGPGGVVLLQTDGRTWRRNAFPEPTDLASIRASDEKTATVTTADGRVFRTADGGLTWTRSPGA